MVGNCAFGLVASLTGTFTWIYVAIALAAGLLAILSMALPAEGPDTRRPSPAPEGCAPDAATRGAPPPRALSLRR